LTAADVIHQHIESLVSREQELWEREARGEATDADRRRLAALKVSLDRSWDLLRQRRALADAGLDPNRAQVRDADVVEHYRQ